MMQVTKFNLPINCNFYFLAEGMYKDKKGHLYSGCPFRIDMISIPGIRRKDTETNQVLLLAGRTIKRNA